jgi:superfamily I DNA and/or RNA helicase/very-short-patch-repair endonuclease
MDTVADQLEENRKKLLDLTLRNRLINYRPTKARTLIIINENPLDIYEILVLKEKQLKFRATKPNNSPVSPSPQSSQDTQQITDNGLPEKESSEWKPQSPDNEVQNRQSNNFLDTPFDEDALKKKLYYIAQESKTIFDEQGYTILFLALGFLDWYESPSAEKPSRAPLILIPVELKRGEVRESFSLQWTNEDILTNLSLKEKLKELGVSLPDFEMPDEKKGIDEYLEKVKKAIHGQKKWNIFSDIYLDFFSFSKFVMYKDLDSTTWPDGVKPAMHPLINAIFNHNPNSPKIPGFDETEVDTKIRVESVYHILDADSSQIAAIEDIKAGKNLVIQGPPGTGKSQTIANAIADLLAQGKTVLFISEKMAALEVVKKRLDNVGLGDFCLELHSKKANIKELHQKIQRTLNIIPPREVNVTDQISHLESLKSELNNYLKSLYTPIGSRNLSPFFLYGRNEDIKKHFCQQSRKMARFQLPDADRISEPEWQVSIVSLNNLAAVLPKVRPVQRHPWYGCNPGVVHPSDEATIKLMIQDTKNAFFELQKKMEALAQVTGLSYPENTNELKNAIGATKLFVSPNPIDRNLLLNDAWNKMDPHVVVTIEKIKNFQQMREQILKKFKTRILDEDLELLLKEFWPLTNQFVLLKIFNSRYRNLKQHALSFYVDGVEHSDKEIINDLSYTLKCINELKQIRADGDSGRSLFGSLWQDEDSNLVRLQEFSAWIVQFRRKMLEDIFTEKTVEMMSQGVSPVTIEKATEELSVAFQIFLRQKFALFQRLNFSFEKPVLQNEEFLEFSKYQLLFSRWEQNISLLQTWSHYANYSQDCKSTHSRYFIDILEEQDLPPEDLVPTFEGNYSEELLKKAFDERPALARFLGDTHESKIQSFVDLDRKIIEVNRWRLIWKLYQKLPDINAEASPNSELGILKQQFERKRGRMPIRQLIKNTGGLIQKINPCFMMGPISVALFLDPRTIKFDVIIFDEASQVRPEDALGALLRGNQAVVMGDSKQLPPTSFFDKMIADEVDDPDSVSSMSSGMESILNLCNVSFPSKTLRWHYRSRHESLIALSNAEFYDNKLFVYPSPAKCSDVIGLTFIHKPETIYDRGKSQINRAEAKIVAEAVFEHFRRHPTKSLGVGTFNIKQQQAILDEVEALRYQHTEMEEFFREDLLEKFFVKNLETIQGDERDVIFLSIGYGKDSNGQLYQNFGPLNQEGGERRLNVIITRAREQCVVFSNFTFRDLKVTESSVLGVKILKLFLQYAESGILPRPDDNRSLGDSESPFEDSVYDFLKSNNCEVEKQIGCAGFRIDMAVVDSRQPGQYLIGIECDGAQYHSSLVARDRDRLRQQVLEGLGWNIHRVWSTDWYRNSAESKRKLVEVIEKIKALPLEKKESKPLEKPVSSIPDPKFVTKNPLTNNNKVQIPDYKFCSSIYPDANLMEIPQNYLEQIICNIVATEGPIHTEELIQRIKSNTGNQRITSRIKERILLSCRSAAARGDIRLQDEFFWQPQAPASVLRTRDSDHGVVIDWICDQEISEAIDYILHQQYATSKDDLIASTLKLLGLQRRTEKANSKISNVIENKIHTKELEILPNGKIDFRK